MTGSRRFRGRDVASEETEKRFLIRLNLLALGFTLVVIVVAALLIVSVGSSRRHFAWSA